MRVAIAARRGLRELLAACVSDGVVIENFETATNLRRQIHLIQPGVVLVDGRLLSTVPRMALVDSQPFVLGLLWKIDRRTDRMAAMAGCWDAVDVSVTSWREELHEALQLARRAWFLRKAAAVGPALPIAA